VTVATSVRRTLCARRLVCQVTCANSAKLLWPALLTPNPAGRPTPGPCPGVQETRVDRPRGHAPGFKKLGQTAPGAMPRGSRNSGRPTPGPCPGVQETRVDRPRGHAPGFKKLG